MLRAYAFCFNMSFMLSQKGKKVRVKKGINGLGLFADERIKKGDFVIRYEGELISTEEADKLKTRYLFQIDENYTIDGSKRENKARYINHFCKPNLEAVVEAGEIVFYALRDIQTGEELGFDYGEEYFAEFIAPKGCSCKSCSP